MLARITLKGKVCMSWGRVPVYNCQRLGVQAMGGTGDIGNVLGRVRMLSLDVDGVLTDGALYYTEDGGQIRKFHVRDGVGMKRVLAVGVEMALITASKTQAIRHRSEDLGIRHVILAR